jgi:hypothetical protein
MVVELYVVRYVFFFAELRFESFPLLMHPSISPSFQQRSNCMQCFGGESKPQGIQSAWRPLEQA